MLSERMLLSILCIFVCTGMSFQWIHGIIIFRTLIIYNAYNDVYVDDTS